MNAVGAPTAQAVPLAQGSGADAAIAALRACGAQRADPIRFHYIEALARRTAGYTGDARRLLDGKLAAALAAYGPTQDAAPGVGGGMPSPAGPASPLAELVRHMQRHAAATAGGSAAEAAAAVEGTADVAAMPGELKDLHFFRSTWAGLRIRRQLTQSLAKVPENAGPLHSDRLVSRSLQLMQALSPAYLNRYMAYVDALLWLDQAQAQGQTGLALARSARGEGNKRRKPARVKPPRA